MRQHEFELCFLDMLETIPYHSVSVTDLCIKMNIGRKNFYRYFENKEDVLLALIDHTIAEYPKYIFPFPDNSKDLIKELEQYLSFWKEKHSLLEALEKNHLGTLLVERVLVHAWRLGSDLLHAEGTIKDPNKVIFAVSGLITLIFVWHHGNYKIPKKQLAVSIQQMFAKPLFSLTDEVSQ